MSQLVPESHPALHSIATEVEPEMISSPKIQKVIKDMRAALRSYNVEGFSAVAIAAPQIGVSLRIFLVEDMSDERKDEEKLPGLVAINPSLIKYSKKTHLVGEGCLSVPEAYGTVRRACQTTLRALDETGEEYERGASGLLAQIFQHEVDHLDGTLFLDRAERTWTKEELETKRVKEAELE